jgi:hypothetical protein
MKKKRLILTLSFATICGGVWAQKQSPLLWPIKGQGAGANILLRPQDLLEHETNYGTLVIGAKEGTEVIAPADGEVSSIISLISRTLPPVLATISMTKQQPMECGAN